ncbi:MAG: tetratricopeptide repeat protein [Pseudomonadota bacterium]
MSDNNDLASAAAHDLYETHADHSAGIGSDETGTEDLKSILKLIATQLQDVDRRQTEVLSQMQQRLEDLEGQTKARKARVPAAYVPAFERIQDGIHQLVERISENRDGVIPAAALGQMAQPTQPDQPDQPDHVNGASNTGFDAGPIPSLSAAITDALQDQIVDGQPDATPTHSNDDSDAGATPTEAFPSEGFPAEVFTETSPLRSALNEDALMDDHFNPKAIDQPAFQAEGHRDMEPDAETLEAPKAIQSPEVDEAETDLDGSDPWDHATAEALTQAYETGETNQPPMIAGFPSLSAAMPAETPALTTTQSVENESGGVQPEAFLSASEPAAHIQTSAASVDFDREWLQERFSEIADRVEQSLADMRPDDSLFALSDRVERMQEDITQALQDVATRDDLDTLKSDEFPVDDLLAHLDRTDAKLDKIVSVDDKLAMVIAQLSDERFNALISEFAPAAPVGTDAPEVDFDKIANVAAAAVAERFAELGPKTNEQAPAVTEMRELLEHFIADQRKDHEQTAGTLDTIQQAMVNILDRVEAMEMSAEAAFMTAPGAGLHSADLDDEDDDYASTSQSSSSSMTFAPAGIAAAVPAAIADPTAPRAAADGFQSGQSFEDDDFGSRTPPAAYGQPAANGQTAPEGQPNDAAYETETGGVIAPDLSPMSPIDRIRQDFIDDARRTKAQVSAQADEEMAAAATKKPGRKSILDGLRGGGKAKEVKSHSAGVDAVLSGSTTTDGDAGGTIFGMRRNTVMIGAFVTLIAVTSALMLMRKDRPVAATPGQPVIERSMETSNEGADKQANLGRASGQPSLEAELNKIVGGPVANLENVPGVDIQPSRRALSAPELAHIQERRSMAQASSKLGQEAARATPAAVMKEFGVSSDNGLAQSAVQRSGLASKLDLPPATVGPLSLRLAAAKGDPSAQFEVAARLAEGKGTNQNFQDAVAWYTRSANQGFAQSMYRLGTMFERGLGVKKNMEKAASHYEQAADRGNVKAMHNLAVLKAGSSTTSPDYLSAAHWFAKAADYGLTDSQYNLAVLFENGLGVKKDLVESYKFYTLSAKSGDAEAVKKRNEVRGKLSSQQSMEAEHMIIKWRPKLPSKIANDARAAGEEWKKRANGQYAS